MKTNRERRQTEGIRILHIDNRKANVSLDTIVVNDGEFSLPQVTVNVKIQEEGLGAIRLGEH